MSKLRRTFIALLIPITVTAAFASTIAVAFAMQIVASDISTDSSDNITPPLNTTPFSDVKEGNSNYVAITYLRKNGIINGYEDNTFRPGQNINRAEALKMIVTATKLLNENEIKSTNDNPFPDVYPTSWFAKYVFSAKERGVINGRGDGNFHPEEQINLVEALKIFFLSQGKTQLEVNNKFLFADTEPDEWFAPYTSYAGSKTILDVNSNNTIDINRLLTRGYLAEIIYRALQSENGYEFGKTTWYGSAVQGAGTSSGEIFDYNLFTAAHRTLPFGTYVEVTNLANGKSVEVKINDRGPHGFGRVLDLSSGAFKQIAPISAGVARVQYKVTKMP